MEANEAIQRVLWRHRWLLIALVLVPIAAIIPLREKITVTYSATASIQAQAAAPDADTQVQAIVARVSAVATNPALVASAIRAAHVSRNAADVAKHDVVATSVGSSAIVSVTVTDPSRAVAVRLASSLAEAVVGKLNGLSSSYAAELTNLAAQSSALTAERNHLLAQLGSRAAQGQATSPVAQARLESLTAVDNELVANSQAQQQIQITVGSIASAQIVSLPTTATGVSRHVAVDAALAGLLGLVIGLLIATTRELARPTVGQPAAGARELGLVLLGDVRVRGGQVTAFDADLPTRLELAGRRLAARTLVLSGPVPAGELAALSERLNDALPCTVSGAGGSRVSGSGLPSLAHYIQDSGDYRTPGDSRRVPSPVGAVSSHSTGNGRSTCTVAALSDLMLGVYPEDPALVIVLPRFAPRASLDRAADLGVTTGWPILGVVGINRKPVRRWLPRSKANRPALALQPRPELLPVAAQAGDGAMSAQSSGREHD